MINKANLATTCGKCHPGANERFSIGKVHSSLAAKSTQPILYWLASGYIEKSEYWALVWGTSIMAATGFIMWFDNFFLGLVTKLGYDIALTIHYYEAWLATLAILVWHIYFVIFNPDSYPINLAFWKGTLTEQEMLEEHPLELAEIKRRKAEGEKKTGA